jgi:hypothetical protein
MCGFGHGATVKEKFRISGSFSAPKIETASRHSERSEESLFDFKRSAFHLNRERFTVGAQHAAP